MELVELPQNKGILDADEKGRTVTTMNDYDYCEECRLYGDDYGYDRDGDLVSNCYDCPMNPDSDAWMR